MAVGLDRLPGMNMQDQIMENIMNKKSSWLTGAICGMALTFGLSLGGYAVGADQSPAPSMQQSITGAKSNGDHEALATQYENEAKELQAKAQAHKEMAKAYGKAGYFGPGGKFDTVRHCNNLARKYEEAAKENFALAKMHRGLAEKAK